MYQHFHWQHSYLIVNSHLGLCDAQIWGENRPQISMARHRSIMNNLFWFHFFVVVYDYRWIFCQVLMQQNGAWVNNNKNSNISISTDQFTTRFLCQRISVSPFFFLLTKLRSKTMIKLSVATRSNNRFDASSVCCCFWNSD